jgi:hypothetical protein
MDDTGKDWPDMETCSFIIKIWIEQGRSEANQAIWRGHITHVPSGERRYLKDLDEIPTIIMPCLEAMGVKLGLGQRIRRWLKRQRLSRKA